MATDPAFEKGQAYQEEIARRRRLLREEEQRLQRYREWHQANDYGAFPGTLGDYDWDDRREEDLQNRYEDEVLRVQRDAVFRAALERRREEELQNRYEDEVRARRDALLRAALERRREEELQDRYEDEVLRARQQRDAVVRAALYGNADDDEDDDDVRDWAPRHDYHSYLSAERQRRR